MIYYETDEKAKIIKFFAGNGYITAISNELHNGYAANIAPRFVQ
jgi:hypothetical protein